MDGALTDTQDGALRTVNAWQQALEQADVNALVSLHASEAVFIGTSSPGFTHDGDGVRDYFVAVFRRHKPLAVRTLDRAVQVFDGFAVVTLLDCIEWDDASPPSPGRVTFVLQPVGPQWKIVSFHRSEVPS